MLSVYVCGILLLGKERFNECQTFVCQQKLFLPALNLYSADSEEFKVYFTTASFYLCCKQCISKCLNLNGFFIYYIRFILLLFFAGAKPY